MPSPRIISFGGGVQSTALMAVAAAHGLTLVTTDRVRRDGTTETLYSRLTREGSRSLPIPMRPCDNGACGL